MTNGTIIRPEDRAAWLAARRETLGASEAPAALGLSPYCSPRELYLRKIGLLPEAEETLAMRMGTFLEPMIRTLYEEETSNEVVAQQVGCRGRGDIGFLSATLDGVTALGFPVEFKTVSARKGGEIGEAGSDDLPDHWIVQAQQQMLLTGTARVDFAVLVGNEAFRVLTVFRNDRLTQFMVGMLIDFWEHVQRREAPEPIGRGHRDDVKIMHVLYPGCEGEVELDESVRDLVEQWQMAKINEWVCREDSRQCRCRILEFLGNAAVGRLPDGRTITRKLVEIPANTIERKAYTRVDLRVKGPGGDLNDD